MSETNSIEHVDLGAIVAPRAPAGFADGVLARFASTEAAIAVEKQRRRRRAAWMAGSVVGAIAAVLAMVLAWPREETSGSIVAERPRSAVIADTRVELAAYASVHWRREGNVIRVEQRGIATWHVPAGQELRVEIEGASAIKATNATLRVEVQMNAEMKKSGVTAGVISAVTVAVIAGKATLSGGGKEIPVEMNRTASMTPGQPPVAVLAAQPQEPIALEVIWPARELSARPARLDELQAALAHLSLPPGSTIGGLAFASGSALNVHLTPAEITAETGQLSDDKPGWGLAMGITAGVDAIAYTPPTRRIVVVVGDGTETDPSDALFTSVAAAGQKQVEIKSLVVHDAAGSRPLDAFGVPVVNATDRTLAAAFTEIVAPPARRSNLSAPTTAVVLVFPADEIWLDHGHLEAVQDALSRLELPMGSTIAAVMYSDRADTAFPPKSVYNVRGDELGTLDRYEGKNGRALIDGIAAGVDMASISHASRRVVIVVGDGHEGAPFDEASEKLARTLDRARADHIAIRAILSLSATSPEPKLFDESAIFHVRAEGAALASTIVEVASPLPTAAIVLYAGRGEWMTKERLDALGHGIETLALPPGSKLAAMEYSTGVATRVRWEPADAFKAEQLGNVADYASHVGSDLILGIGNGLTELENQPLPRKLLIIVGDGIETINAHGSKYVPLIAAQANRSNIAIRVVNVRAADTLQRSLLGELDSGARTATGAGATHARAIESILNGIGSD